MTSPRIGHAAQIAPVQWYETRGMLQLVDGNRRPAAVMFALMDLIEGVGAAVVPALEYC